MILKLISLMIVHLVSHMLLLWVLLLFNSRKIIIIVIGVLYWHLYLEVSGFGLVCDIGFDLFRAFYLVVHVFLSGVVFILRLNLLG